MGADFDIEESISLSKRFGLGKKLFACAFHHILCFYKNTATLFGWVYACQCESEREKYPSFHFQSFLLKGVCENRSIPSISSIIIFGYVHRKPPFPSGRRETLINGHTKHDLFLWPAPLSSVLSSFMIVARTFFSWRQNLVCRTWRPGITAHVADRIQHQVVP